MFIVIICIAFESTNEPTIEICDTAFLIIDWTSFSDKKNVVADKEQ